MVEVETKGTYFLLAPIGAPRSEVRQRSEVAREFVIQPAAESAGYRLPRADDLAAPGNITTQIIRLVVDAPLVIADLSGANPNVMYELAVRHAIGKPVIHVTMDARHIPFDMASYRVIVIDVQDGASVRRSQMQILEAIRVAEKDVDRVDTPISAAVNLAGVRRRLSSEFAQEAPQEAGVLSALADINERLRGLEYRLTAAATETKTERPYSRRIFLVHSHDGELKNELARLLERLQFEPVILHELADRGDTIFAKLTGEMSDVGFAFVLLTPDDIGGSGPANTALKPRARQNVVFEHGLFVGHLRSDRVCAITKGEVELPSDLHGVLYKPIHVGGSVASITFDIVKELRAAGYEVDANRL